MRKVTLVAICSLVLGTVVLPSAATASPPDDVFRGFWTSVDHDGSNQTLTIQGTGKGEHHAMRLFDDSATGACDGAPAQVQGSGLVDGDNLLMRGALTCKPGGNPFHGRISVGFFYDLATDTLTDEFGVTWSRA